MGIKGRVLEVLENNRGQYISGEQLGSDIGVSRNAVWKAIGALRRDGFDIASLTNNGYMLKDGSDVVSKDGIERFLAEAAPQFDIRIYKRVASTNTTAKELAAEGAAEGTLVCAAEQSGGKGRRGRAFFSPGGGIYMSLLLRPKIPAGQAVMITAAAAVAVLEAVERISGKTAGIKWVNDVFIGEGKICGILTEAALNVENDFLEYAVLGVGINMAEPEEGYPQELRGVAGAVFKNGENRPDNAKNRIIAAFLRAFSTYYHELTKKTFLKKYVERSNVIGRDIMVLRGGEARQAVAVDIDGECRLLVRYENGETEHISSGEVSIRRVDEDEER